MGLVTPRPKQRPPDPAAPDASPPLVAAEAAGGMIQVSFHSNGLIRSIHLDPRVKRLAVDELAEGLVEAISTVQAELVRQAATALEARRAADQSLDEKIQGIHSEYLLRTAEFQHIGHEILKRMKE
jgi:DNA-binding protein YbaB